MEQGFGGSHELRVDKERQGIRCWFWDGRFYVPLDLRGCEARESSRLSCIEPGTQGSKFAKTSGQRNLTISRTPIFFVHTFVVINRNELTVLWNQDNLGIFVDLLFFSILLPEWPRKSWIQTARRDLGTQKSQNGFGIYDIICSVVACMFVESPSWLVNYPRRTFWLYMKAWNYLHLRAASSQSSGSNWSHMGSTNPNSRDAGLLSLQASRQQG